MLDTLWMNHLEDMEALQESVRLRAVGQHDPLVEYRRDGSGMYQAMLANFEQWMAENKEKLEEAIKAAQDGQAPSVNVSPTAKVVENLSAPVAEGDGGSSQQTVNSKQQGINDLCACGSGKKYKKCHGK